MLPDFDRADRIDEFIPAEAPFAELLIDSEENRTLRAVLVGMLGSIRSSCLTLS
jgi:hypothetical protein